MASVTLRVPDELLERVDELAGEGGRSAWLIAAARARADGGLPVVRVESATVKEVREAVSLAASRLLDAVEQYSQEARVQKPSEARNLLGAMREMVRFAVELEVLEKVGELPDDPEEVLKLFQDLVALAREAVKK